MVHQAEALSSYEERRQHPRFSVKLPLDYWETTKVVQGGLLANISETGLLIHSALELRIGAELNFRVYIWYLWEVYGLDQVEGKGQVIWGSRHREGKWKGYKYGLSITHMAPDDRERVRQVLMLLQEESKKRFLLAYGMWD